MSALHHTDMLAWLQDYDGPLFDSCVTDPPYHLTSIVKRFGGEGAAPARNGKGDNATGAYARASKGFMGKTWDGGDIAQRPETWRAVYDALKPGAHLVAFSGTRTYHRMACAIEDAGFEIREMLLWHYGQGFPKSHNVFKKLIERGLSCACHKAKLSSHYVSEERVQRLQDALDAQDSVSGGAQQNLRTGVCGQENVAIAVWNAIASQNCGDGELLCLREAEGNATGMAQESQSPDLQSSMQRCSTRSGVGEARLQGCVSANSGELCESGNEGRAQSGLEGWCDPEAPEGELHRRSLCEGPRLGFADGAKGPLHNGASASDGADVRLPFDTNGGGQSHRPQPVKQSPEQPRIVADERGSQTWGGWPVCGGCRKPIIPEGLGTALKPSVEPVCLARKPLSEKSIAANVLKWGTGALNIDGCRVGTSGARNNGRKVDSDIYGKLGAFERVEYNCGRWPANLLHDGSDEVVAGFLETGKMGAPTDDRGQGGIWQSGNGKPCGQQHGDSGSAARFFYSAKAGPLDRIGTAHATVKPVDLMRWLARLVTPPGGHILEPFAGSGTTGIAAMAEGFACTMLELEAEHVADIERKMAFLRGDGGVGMIERHKARIDRAKDEGAGPLFGEVAA